MMGLTPVQAETLAFIETYITEAGYAPSYSEIREALGLASNSGVLRLVDALVERGRIRRLPHRARAIEIVDPLDAKSTADLRAMRDRIDQILCRRTS